MVGMAFVLMLATAQAPAPLVPLEPVPELGVRTVRGDLRPSGFASTGGDDDGYVWVSADLCTTGAASKLEYVDLQKAGVVWRVAIQTVDHTGDIYVLKADWERIYQGGERLTAGPKGSQQLSMRAGERVLLDQSVPLVATRCDIVEAQLQASVSLRPASRDAQGLLRAAAGARASGGGIGPSGSGGARVGAGGGGGISGSGGGRVGAAPRASAAAADATPDRLATRGINAELWLVHTRPDGTEEVQRRATAAGGKPDYAFAPVIIPTAQGIFKVDVTGFLAATDEPIQHLSLMIDRRISVEATGGTVSRSSGVKQLARPAPAEVVAFEIPEGRTAALPLRLYPDRSTALALLAGHQFSLRLRAGANK